MLLLVKEDRQGAASEGPSAGSSVSKFSFLNKAPSLLFVLQLVLPLPFPFV